MSKRKKRRLKRGLPTKPNGNSVEREDGSVPTGIQYVPFGREIYFSNQPVEDGDYFLGLEDQIIGIRDDGLWHEVEQDPESGEYWATGWAGQSLMALIARDEAIPEDDTTAISRAWDGESNPADWERSWTPTSRPKQSVTSLPKGPAGYMVIEETKQIYTTYNVRIVEKLREKLPHTKSKEGGAPVFTLPINRLRFRQVSPSVQMCGFNGTDQFLKHWLGRELDKHDETWYRHHQGTDDHGLGLAWVLTCLHQLVTPYGVGISRVRFPLDRYNVFENRAEWTAALGMNPLAMANSNVTNAMFAEQMGQSLAEVDQLFRIDYLQEPLIPSVTAFEMSKAMASGGGHIEYLGPRGPKDSHRAWGVSVQFDFLDRFEYYAPLVLTPYKEKDSVHELVWDQIKDETGQKNLIEGYTYYYSSAPYGSHGDNRSGAQYSLL